MPDSGSSARPDLTVDEAIRRSRAPASPRVVATPRSASMTRCGSTPVMQRWSRGHSRSMHGRHHTSWVRMRCGPSGAVAHSRVGPKTDTVGVPEYCREVHRPGIVREDPRRHAQDARQRQQRRLPREVHHRSARRPDEAADHGLRRRPIRARPYQRHCPAVRDPASCDGCDMTRRPLLGSAVRRPRCTREQRHGTIPSARPQECDRLVPRRLRQ